MFLYMHPGGRLGLEIVPHHTLFPTKQDPVYPKDSAALAHSAEEVILSVSGEQSAAPRPI
jgi:hypothetical protein